MIKYFVDDIGRYLGAFDGADPPEGSVEIDGPPIRAFDIWNGSEWTTGTVPVPSSITMRQARLALFDAGLLDDVTAAINAFSSPAKEIAQIEWEYSNNVERTWPLLQTIGTAIGLDSGEIDALFVEAATL